jgi:hypothetical protein
MGGFGSGGHNAVGCGTAEGSRSLDVMKLHRAGCLRPGYWGGWCWSYEDGASVNIGLRAGSGKIVLSYRRRRLSDDWEPVEQSIPILWEPCHFGGQRPWFRCDCVSNGRYCGRKVGELYGAGRHFACRHCYHLGYQSQLERGHWLRLHRANKLRRKLGGDPGMASPLPEKPKGMHRVTDERALDDIFRLECAADEALAALWEARLRR